MIGAPIGFTLLQDHGRQLQQGPGQVPSGGGAAYLLVHHLDGRAGAHQLQNDVDEIAGKRTEKPGGAHDEVPWAGGADQFLAFELGQTVLVYGCWRIALQVGPGLPSAAKDVIRGDMNKRYLCQSASLGQILRSLGVRRQGSLGVAFSLVHVGKGGRVDHQVGLVPSHGLQHLLWVDLPPESWSKSLS